jgi:ABC-type antimicrobial peptide transport system permease subunit
VRLLGWTGGCLDSDVPASQIRTMTEILGQSAGNQALIAVLLSSFAALALAAVGLYGVVSYLVSQRTAEIGIRMALGARRTQVCWMILLDGIRPVVPGLLAGSLAAVALTRTLRRLLFGIKPDDVPTYIIVAFLMIAVAVLASLVPAWHATRIDPANALRSE